MYKYITFKNKTIYWKPNKPYPQVDFVLILDNSNCFKRKYNIYFQ